MAFRDAIDRLLKLLAAPRGRGALTPEPVRGPPSTHRPRLTRAGSPPSSAASNASSRNGDGAAGS